MNTLLSHQKHMFVKQSIFWLLFVICSQAIAESLPDPTRPFNAVAPLAAQAEPVLQSILISRSQQVAIIDGKRVSVGESYDGTRLVSLADGEAVLKGRYGKKKITLFPSNEKYAITWNKQPSNYIPDLDSYIVHRR